MRTVAKHCLAFVIVSVFTGLRSADEGVQAAGVGSVPCGPVYSADGLRVGFDCPPCGPLYCKDPAAAARERAAKAAQMRAAGFPERLIKLLDQYDCVGCIRFAPDSFTILLHWAPGYRPTDGQHSWEYETVQWTRQDERLARKDLREGKLLGFYIMNAGQACKCCGDKQPWERSDWNSDLEMNMGGMLPFTKPQDLGPDPPELSEVPKDRLEKVPQILARRKPPKPQAHASCPECNAAAEAFNSSADAIDSLWDQKIGLLHRMDITRQAMAIRANQIARLEYDQIFDPKDAVSRQIDELKKVNEGQGQDMDYDGRKLAGLERDIREAQAREDAALAKLRACEASTCGPRTAVQPPNPVTPPPNPPIPPPPPPSTSVRSDAPPTRTTAPTPVVTLGAGGPMATSVNLIPGSCCNVKIQIMIIERLGNTFVPASSFQAVQAPSGWGLLARAVLGLPSASRLARSARWPGDGTAERVPVALTAAREPTQPASPVVIKALVTSLGIATGEAFEMRLFNDSHVDATVEGDGVVVEAYTPDAAAQGRRLLDQRAAVTPVVVKLNGYCLEMDRLPPSLGQPFHIAALDVQQKFAPLRTIVRAARKLQDARQLQPDGDPVEYVHSMKQWALWTREKGFTRESFGRAFVEHAKKNFEAARQPWSKDIEHSIAGLVPHRWDEIQWILQEADRMSGAGGSR